jgi:LSU ribosomal protein L18AE
VIPGKVLGSGVLTKDVTVAAVDFSSTAETKIDQAGEAVSIDRLLADNPSGSGVRILR